jgi:hypothetical protein
LKDQGFSTLLGQNPPFELRPKWGFAYGRKGILDPEVGVKTEALAVVDPKLRVY